MNWIKHIFLGIILLIIATPFLQFHYEIIDSHALRGAFTPALKAEYSDSAWLKGSFQFQYERHLEDSIGFRSDLIRLHNQLDFSLFGLSNAYSIRVGKSNFLFYLEGIFNNSGKKILPQEFVKARVHEYSRLQNYFMEKHGILLLLVITPDKAQFYSEYIPDRLLRNSKGPMIYTSYIHELKETGARYLDFNRYFLSMKDSSSHILFPKTGSHWSSYGALYAFDSLSQYISRMLKIEMPVRVVDAIEVTKELHGNDGDLAETLNLIWEPNHAAMSYADYHFVYPAGTIKPRALFIGDSFYWQWGDPFIIENNFEDPHFWYYNKRVYPESWTKYTSTFDLDFTKHVMSQDIICLIQSMSGSCRLGYGFLERAYAEIFLHEKLELYMNAIRTNKEWLKSINDKALDRGEPIDRTIYREALYCVKNELRTKNSEL